MKHVVLFWVGVPALVFLGVGALSICLSKWGAKSGPSIKFPQRVNLGSQERGAVALGRFSIANQGTEALVIDDIRTNCSCAGLEQEVEGSLRRIESLTVQPGQQSELVIRMSVNGQSGQTVRSVISFRSNDPHVPAAALEAVVPQVKAGVVTTPTSIVFGTIPVDTIAQQVLEIRDEASVPSKIREVSSTDPSVLTVRLLDGANFPRTQNGRKGVLLGRAEVVLRGRAPRVLSESIDVHLADKERPARRVFVSARVANIVEASPCSLVLPRASGSGPLYEGTCLLRTVNSPPFELSVESLPMGIIATISESVAVPGAKHVQIKWTPEVGGDKPRVTRLIRLRAEVDQSEVTIQIPVYCLLGAQ